MKRARLLVNLQICVLSLSVTGCSLGVAFQQMRDARRTMAEGEEALARKDYSRALASYIEARRLLISTRELGYTPMVDDSRLESIDDAIAEVEDTAEENGFVRWGDRLLGEEEIGKALADSLARLFSVGRLSGIAQDRVVPESVEATARRASGSNYDMEISLVLKDRGGEEEFPRDVWAVVRCLFEGGYGHGFSYHFDHPFPERPWMGKEGVWGISEKRGVENEISGLKGRIEGLGITVYRGRYRHREEEKYGTYGFKTLEAVGPYWKKEYYRRYRLDGKNAGRLNWAEARLVPDATLYGMLEMDDGRLREEKDNE